MNKLSSISSQEGKMKKATAANSYLIFHILR